MPTKMDESPQARGTDANHDAGYDIEPTPIGDANINTQG